MTKDDILKFMTLAYTRLRLGQFMVGDFSFEERCPPKSCSRWHRLNEPSKEDEAPRN